MRSTDVLPEPIKELVLINTTENTAGPLLSSDETKNLVKTRAEAVVWIVAGFTAFIVVIVSTVLGTTGIFTIGGAVTLGLVGGVVGGAALGLLSGGVYYIKKMWHSFSWTTNPDD